MNKLPHLVISGKHESRGFTTTIRGRASTQNLERERESHGNFLLSQLREAWQQATEVVVDGVEAKSGVYLEFASEKGWPLETKSLEDLRSKKVRLLNVRSQLDENEQETTFATVFVDKDKSDYFVNKIHEYLTEEVSDNKPKHQALVNSVSNIKTALVKSFWTGDSSAIPADIKDWVEVWLRTEDEEDLIKFKDLLSLLNIEHKTGLLKFPERFVKLIHANQENLVQLIHASDFIAEFREAKDTANFFMNLDAFEQAEWIEDLSSRIHKNEDSNSSVCIFDTGINRQHPLLKEFLNSNDCQAVYPYWGVHDHDGHGTLMAGAALYGDLTPVLLSSESVSLEHVLESVKILPNQGCTQKELWGDITGQAVGLAEIQAPYRQRTFCMAVTSPGTKERGRPTSWSAAIDQLTAKDGEQRLFLISAGNSVHNVDLATVANNYPDSCILEPVQDPAQSWNGLSVGAVTNLDQITDPDLSGYRPVAKAQTLSPFTTTSATWEENKWPIKPELVFEGGNLAIDAGGFATEADDLSILSTSYTPSDGGYFQSFKMTSAATAQVAKMAATIRAKYPDFWEETVRALLVHSASWPKRLKEQLLATESKTDYQYLLKVCGYGVPNLERALYSASNSLTLISEAEIQPFERNESGNLTTKEMHFYDLPWPVDVLQSLPLEQEIKMKVTLSYFIEPSPGEVGWKDKYRYASHGLRFEVNNPNETQAEFLERVNKKDRPSSYDSERAKSSADFWMLGVNARNRGSIHSDTWQGTCAELATSNFIAVMPVTGWWRARPHLNKFANKTRYSLIVSIETAETDIDIYTPIAMQIQPEVEITVQV